MKETVPLRVENGTETQLGVTFVTVYSPNNSQFIIILYAK